MGGSKAQRNRRARRVLELTTAGMTIPDISEMMKSEGFAASERTVWRDLNSVEAKDYQDEILRKQLTDITLADIGLRLKYRDKLLDKLMPQKIEQKISGERQQKMEVKHEVAGLEDYIDVIVEQILEEQLEGDRNADPDKDLGESVDPVEPDAGQP